MALGIGTDVRRSSGRWAWLCTQPAPSGSCRSVGDGAPHQGPRPRREGARWPRLSSGLLLRYRMDASARARPRARGCGGVRLSRAGSAVRCVLGAGAPCARPTSAVPAPARPALIGSQGALEVSRVTLLLQVKSAAPPRCPSPVSRRFGERVNRRIARVPPDRRHPRLRRGKSQVTCEQPPASRSPHQ